MQEKKLEGKIQGQTLLPEDHFGLSVCNCRARVKISSGSAYGRYHGSYTQCSKPVRKGKKTCWWHRKLEEDEE